MRIQCTECDELFEAQSAVIAGESLSIACAHCKESIFLAIAGERGAPAQPEVTVASKSGESCPKCSSAVQPNDAACAVCGLAADLFADFNPEQGGDELDGAWLRLEENWHSDHEHEAFMGVVAGSGDYRGGAARYRACEGVNGRSERCRKMLDRIQSMATAALLSTKPTITEDHKEPFKNVVVLLIALLLLGGTAGVYFMFIKAKNQPRPKGPLLQAPRMALPGAASGVVTPVLKTEDEAKR